MKKEHHTATDGSPRTKCPQINNVLFLLSEKPKQIDFFVSKSLPSHRRWTEQPGMANKDSGKNGKDMPAASAMETVFSTSLVPNEEILDNTPAFAQKANVVFEAFCTK